MALVFFFVASMGVDEAEVPVDAVGKRVSCGGERATVRYFGPVPPTAGRTRVVPLTHHAWMNIIDREHIELVSMTERL